MDDCFQHASPDAGISYSFDAPRGPHQGSQILSMALAKAVEKFEVKATEKMVKDEYEVIGQDKEDPDGHIAYDDDFELVWTAGIPLQNRPRNGWCLGWRKLWRMYNNHSTSFIGVGWSMRVARIGADVALAVYFLRRLDPAMVSRVIWSLLRLGRRFWSMLGFIPLCRLAECRWVFLSAACTVCSAYSCNSSASSYSPRSSMTMLLN